MGNQWLLISLVPERCLHAARLAKYRVRCSIGIQTSRGTFQRIALDGDSHSLNPRLLLFAGYCSCAIADWGGSCLDRRPLCVLHIGDGLIIVVHLVAMAVGLLPLYS